MHRLSIANFIFRHQILHTLLSITLLLGALLGTDARNFQKCFLTVLNGKISVLSCLLYSAVEIATQCTACFAKVFLLQFLALNSFMLFHIFSRFSFATPFLMLNNSPFLGIHGICKEIYSPRRNGSAPRAVYVDQLLQNSSISKFDLREAMFRTV